MQHKQRHYLQPKSAMAGLTTSSFLSLSLHLLLVLLPAATSDCSAEPNRGALFIFGDSFLDAGNNNYINTTTLDRADFWPYGETYFEFPTGRFSDGRLVSDFVGNESHITYELFLHDEYTLFLSLLSSFSWWGVSMSFSFVQMQFLVNQQIFCLPFGLTFLSNHVL